MSYRGALGQPKHGSSEQQREPQAKRHKMHNGGAADGAQPADASSPSDCHTAMEHNGVAAAGAQHDADYDTNLYSRQLYTLGDAAMRRLRKARVLVVGMGGVGVEIAKNLILGGVKFVTVQDTASVQWLDLSSQYYVSAGDIGKNRATVSLPSLEELNDSVTVTASTEPVDEHMVKLYDLTVITDTALKRQLEINGWARAHNKKSLVADARGLFAMIFDDFGNEHNIDDSNGEQCVQVMIEHIDKVTGDVTTLEDAYHNLQDGDHVQFEEVKGLEALNGCAPIPITVKGRSKFNVGQACVDMSGSYVEGGRAKQVKVTQTTSFKSLQQSLAAPDFVHSDFAKMTRPPQLHRLWQALHAFEAAESRSPKPRCKADAARLKELVLLSESGCESNDEVDDELLHNFAYSAMGNLCPMTSFVGGVAAQEAMKAVTGIFTPLKQYLYFDALECLPGDWCPEFDSNKLTEEMCAPRECRYDGTASVFGWRFVDALKSQRWLLVGAGAIGCELLKNFSMMALCCGKEGRCTVTDMDNIELSNLNRQFLFRRHDVGGKKSTTAINAVLGFNADFNGTSMAERVGPETESIFDDAMFAKLHGVANALDNVEARAYMDRRCVYYRLPLLESGTMGPKGNTQVVYPHLTESYASSSDPPEKSIPICTLKNFPNAIEHTIQWARDLFEGLFTNPSDVANQWLDDPRAFAQRADKMHAGQRLELYTDARSALIDNRPADAEACVTWARRLWQDNFDNQIAQLLHNFPAEQTTEQGARFWSGSKRCPHTLAFDVDNHDHYSFVYAASILHALQYGLKPIVEEARVKSIAGAYVPDAFVPRSGLRIATTDAEAQQISNDPGGDDVDAQVEAIQLALAHIRPERTARLTVVDFEKDDDTNHHMEMVAAGANLRAANYDIERADFIKIKQIAGRIIPAIATTTAAVGGLVALEMYKMVAAGPMLRPIPLERFKCGFLNLALPFFAFSEPIAAPKKKYGETEFTLWDCIEVRHPMKLNELIDHMKARHNLSISMVSAGVSLLYSFFMAAAKRTERLAMTVPELVRSVTGRRVPPHVNAIVLEIMADYGNDEVETPYVKYVIRDA